MYFIMLIVKQGGIKNQFWVFGVTRPGIEPLSPGPLVNALLIRPVNTFYLYIFLLYLCKERKKCYPDGMCANSYDEIKHIVVYSPTFNYSKLRFYKYAWTYSFAYHYSYVCMRNCVYAELTLYFSVRVYVCVRSDKYNSLSGCSYMSISLFIVLS